MQGISATVQTDYTKINKIKPILLIYTLLKIYTQEIPFFCECAVNSKIIKAECSNLYGIELRKDL